jgi:hypothetical protein
MLGRLKGARPSPALAISLVALFVSIGGIGYAATTITGKNVKNGSLTGKDVKNSSLTGSDVKNSSLTGKDIKNNSLTGSDVKESKLGKVPSAGTADTAGSARISQVKTVTVTGTATGTTTGDGLFTATATCPAGLNVVGGGSQVSDPTTEYVNDMWPSSATAYTARVFNPTDGTTRTFTVYAICAPAAATG